MGNCCLPVRFRRTPSAVNPKNITLLLLGLDNSGKSTIAKRLSGEPLDSVVPTVGFSVIQLRQKDCQVSIYDLGGGLQIRSIWPRYYADAHGVIFVTDAHDIQKMEECRQVLESILRHEQISGKPVLVLANKQDLDGALDEIDIVTNLNLENLVNEQKCPTLVELCSALDFGKKMDLGIDYGYKWLLRSVIRDYPALNYRVLRDLAKQEEENKVHVISRPNRERNQEEIENHVDLWPLGDPFRSVSEVLDEKHQLNGIAKNGPRINMAQIPGHIKETEDKQAQTKKQVCQEAESSTIKTMANSYSSEFFVLERFQSDLQLLNDVSSQSFKTFLVRPKSSGARLYGVEKDKRKTHRRKPLQKLNKTGPVPPREGFEYQDRMKHRRRGSKDDALVENINPFLVKTENSVSKSTPSSRRSSMVFEKKRRNSMIQGKLVDTELLPLKINNKLSNYNREILLDVTKLAQ